MIYETYRLCTEQSAHLEWIRKSLDEVQEENHEIAGRLRAVEDWKAGEQGKERRRAGGMGIAGAALGTVAGTLFNYLDIFR